VLGLELFELIERGSCCGRIMPVTLQLRDDLALESKVLVASFDVGVSLRQIALEHLMVHVPSPWPRSAEALKGLHAAGYLLMNFGGIALTVADKLNDELSQDRHNRVFAINKFKVG
jgi:hypothetical protein